MAKKQQENQKLTVKSKNNSRVKNVINILRNNNRESLTHGYIFARNIPKEIE